MPRFITRFRSERLLDLTTEAADRDAALAAAREALKTRCDGSIPSEWKAEGIELVEPDDEGTDVTIDDWSISGACEACNRTLFDAEGHHGEDCDLCDSCFEAAKAEAIAEHIAARRRETGQELSAEEAWDQMRAEVDGDGEA